MTRFDRYAATGYVERVTAGHGTAAAMSTEYEYDAFGSFLAAVRMGTIHLKDLLECLDRSSLGGDFEDVPASMALAVVTTGGVAPEIGQTMTFELANGMDLIIDLDSAGRVICVEFH